MKRTLFVLGLVLLFVLTVTPPPVHADTIYNFSYVFEFYEFVPCAADGYGESVFLSGNMHLTYSVTSNKNGGFHVKIHENAQGVTGYGLTTGDHYRANEVAQTVFQVGAGEEYTHSNSYRIIGQGPRNNFLIHQSFHVIVNANGELTSLMNHYSFECR